MVLAKKGRYIPPRFDKYPDHEPARKGRNRRKEGKNGKLGLETVLNRCGDSLPFVQIKKIGCRAHSTSDPYIILG